MPAPEWENKAGSVTGVVTKHQLYPKPKRSGCYVAIAKSGHPTPKTAAVIQ